MQEPSLGNRPAADGAGKSSPPGFPDRFLLNDTGLRAGWRLLIYAVVFLGILTAFTFVQAAFFRPPRGVFSLGIQFSSEVLSLVAAIGAAWVMSMIEDRPLGVYGLPRRGAFGKLFWQGCLFGWIEILVLVGVIAAFGGYSFGSLAERGGGIAVWGMFWAGYFLVVGFFEEFLFRGYALYTLADGVGFWTAALMMAVCFGAVHRQNGGENWIGLTGVALVGVFWTFTLRRTGSLWFAVGMHATFDFGETFVFSVPDSGMVFPGHLSNATLHGPSWLTGGTPGPEASIIDFVILVVFFVVFDRLYPARKTASFQPMADSGA